MVDRQDIDALLISALYGELTPAEEARLTTHLESHPTDKTVLADLTRTRATLRESRFLTVQLEPPQAVSAILLQEATALRPKAVAAAEQPTAKEGWFSRFIGSFARHPAMAAAAMLVVVVGVAGTMYMRNGDKAMVAEQTTSTFGGAKEEAAGAPAPAIAEQAKQLQQQAGSGYQAQLADPHSGMAADDFKAADKPTDKGENEKLEAPKEAKKDSVADTATIRRDAPKATPPRTYIGTERAKNQQPMDLEEAPSKPDPAVASIPDGNATRAPGNGTREGRAPEAGPSAPSPKPTAARPQTAPKGGAGGATGGDDAVREGENRPDPEAQWAREQHVRVTTAVKANNCKEAASLALQLSNRAPGYYQQNVENDRSLKQCVPYINAEREKEAERQQRARALQKRNADEAKRPANTNSK